MFNSNPINDTNTATLQRFYKAEADYLFTSDRNFSAIAETLDPECVLFQPASLPYGGEWRGHSGFEGWMKSFSDQWASMELRGSQQYGFDDVIISKSHVFARTKLSGKEVDWPLLQFIRFRAGKILELSPFYWDTATLLESVRSQS